MKIWTGFIAAMMGFVVFSSCAMAQTRPLTDFTGRWAIKADGQNLMILRLDLQADTHAVTGSLLRPDHMNLSGRTVMGVALPVVTEQVVEAKANSDGLALSLKAGDGAVTNFEMVLKGTNSAELKIVGVPVAPWPLTRVGDDAQIATAWDPQHAYRLTEILTHNATMTQMYEADQSDRTGAPIDPVKLVTADKQRREAARALLDHGDLHTGIDFLHAAVIFQHGEQPDDFLLAHVLATAALQMGRSDAGWIAAASLDRYLLASGKAQIYGTQYMKGQGQSSLDRGLVPDSLRVQMGVPPLEDQHAPTVLPKP